MDLLTLFLRIYGAEKVWSDTIIRSNLIWSYREKFKPDRNRTNFDPKFTRFNRFT